MSNAKHTQGQITLPDGVNKNVIHAALYAPCTAANADKEARDILCRHQTSVNRLPAIIVSDELMSNPLTATVVAAFRSIPGMVEV